MWKVRWQWQAGGCSECVSLLLEAKLCTNLAPELEFVIMGVTVCPAIKVTIQLQVVSTVVVVSRTSPYSCGQSALSSSRLALA